jgi:hypothetical protein
MDTASHDAVIDSLKTLRESVNQRQDRRPLINKFILVNSSR